MNVLNSLLIFTLAVAAIGFVTHCKDVDSHLQSGWNRMIEIAHLIIFILTLILPLSLGPAHTEVLSIHVMPQFNLDFKLQYDALTAVMLLLVSFMSLIIQSYARRYLSFDRQQSRFSAQITLLTFTLILLMVSGNLLTAFVAWQWLGLSLYLLLNHYHFDFNANRAAKKKFMINRIGDLCFLIAVSIMLIHYHSTDFSHLMHLSHTNELVLSLVFIAVMTKSAQFPFHIWLIDTMEAPTPVSAIMHAGIINSGGFLLARLSYAYSQYLGLMLVISLIGLTTALLGKIFMTRQVDIKKQLAYSTMGQMGYMILQCGMGAFIAAVFHLISHGFLKASLFLSSGNTLKQNNKTANNTKSFTLLNLAISLIIALALISTSIHLHLIIRIFIAITLFELTLRSLQTQKTLGLKLSSIILVVALYFAYLEFIEFFHLSLDTSVNTLWTSHYSTFLLCATAVTCALLFFFMATMKKNYQSFILYKGHIELFYRQYLLNPVRSIGEYLLKLLKRPTAQTFALIITLAFIVLSFLLPHVIYLNLILLLLVLVVANRARSLNEIFNILIIASIFFTLVLISLSHEASTQLGIYQLINSIILIAAFFLIYVRRSKRQKTIKMGVNRLPWCHFYMSVFLLLFIGIPGSASFVSEFYLFMQLISHSFASLILFSICMFLFALVILHALQKYFFNPHAIEQYAIRMSIPLHAVCLIAIIFNLFSGLYPALLLKAISGGAA